MAQLAINSPPPQREARGDVEFQTDGTSVNTWEGWREMKIGLFLKRERGDAATPDEWDTRSLPAPHARLTFAAIEKCDRFCKNWSGILRINRAT